MADAVQLRACGTILDEHDRKQKTVHRSSAISGEPQDVGRPADDDSIVVGLDPEV
jgi:hypothetical protein